MYLLDTSVINRLDITPVAEALKVLAINGDIFTTTITQLELLSGNRTPKSNRLPSVVGLETGDDRVAIAMSEQLIKANNQRGRKPGDLLIAAIAIRTGFTVIHYDHDYDAILSAKSTPPFKAEWIVPVGTIS